MLVNLLLPSVRILVSSHLTDQAAVLTACALRQAGYQHTWAPCILRPDTMGDAIRAIAQCRLDEANMDGDQYAAYFLGGFD
jgi:hypothetical protein